MRSIATALRCDWAASQQTSQLMPHNAREKGKRLSYMTENPVDRIATIPASDWATGIYGEMFTTKKNNVHISLHDNSVSVNGTVLDHTKRTKALYKILVTRYKSEQETKRLKWKMDALAALETI